MWAGYFNLVNASLRDNYHAGQLLCNGNDFNSTLNCVGFDNALGDAVFYVTVARSAQFASYKMLLGQPGPQQVRHPSIANACVVGPSSSWASRTRAGAAAAGEKMAVHSPLSAGCRASTASMRLTHFGPFLYASNFPARKQRVPPVARGVPVNGTRQVAGA